jgi:predicted phosphodiesterase
MKLAIISDIHGNQIALEAVLADIKYARVDQIICLGDIANVGPHPGQCIDIVRSLNCPVLQGNHELYLLGRFEDERWRTSSIWAGMRWAQAQINPDQLAYIDSLPCQYVIEGNGRAGAAFVHASPLSQYWGFMPFHNDADIAKRMNGLDNTTLFCGHTHIPLYRPWSNSWLVNAGSVGMPLDGTPTAKYVIATQQKYEWHVEYRMVEYDLDQLMAEFDAVGLQQVGGKVTAVFRYQMLTGQSLAPQLFNEIHHLMETKNITAEQALAKVAVPAPVLAWCNGQRGSRGAEEQG